MQLGTGGASAALSLLYSAARVGRALPRIQRRGLERLRLHGWARVTVPAPNDIRLSSEPSESGSNCALLRILPPAEDGLRDVLDVHAGDHEVWRRVRLRQTR